MLDYCTVARLPYDSKFWIINSIIDEEEARSDRDGTLS